MGTWQRDEDWPIAPCYDWELWPIFQAAGKASNGGDRPCCSNFLDKSWVMSCRLSEWILSLDFDFFSLVLLSWKGESASAGITLSRMHLDELEGEAGFASLSKPRPFLFFIGAPTDEGLEWGTIEP